MTRRKLLAYHEELKMSFKLLNGETGKEAPYDGVIYTLPSTIPDGCLLSYQEPYSNVRPKTEDECGFFGMYRSAKFEVRPYHSSGRLCYLITVTASSVEDMAHAIAECRKRLDMQEVDIRPRFIVRLPQWLITVSRRIRLITVEVTLREE